ncbi:hypothetical protein MEA186_36009 [Mesorhizobium amorphae CCNWGS0123]|uniref:Uncharacterized protein n=1 Tax=Mesorhizobium amorphae CCNWGS0123 TaxID=1082933 RepID=G6YME4_9HYPH|nr:hypothetical protein MEA186_36009 [Mesorhizobium amorphae CCNWGS0123]
MTLKALGLPAYPIDGDHPTNAGLKLQSGYALPAFQPASILILLD